MSNTTQAVVDEIKKHIATLPKEDQDVIAGEVSSLKYWIAQSEYNLLALTLVGAELANEPDA
jgi:hypothetical protein